MGDETKKLADELRFQGLDATAHITELTAENKLQAKRIEILDEEVDAFRSSEAYRRLERLCDELKEEIATLRATVELVERADANVQKNNGLQWDPRIVRWVAHVDGHEVVQDTLREALEALGEKT